MLNSDRFAHYDAVEPGREPLRVTKALGVSPGALERDLDGILGVGAVAADQDGDAQEPLVAFGYELLECLNARRVASSEPGALQHHTLLTR